MSADNGTKAMCEADEILAELSPRAFSIVNSVKTTAQILAMPAPIFLIGEWLVLGSLVCLYGKPAALKSLIAQSWAFSLVSGRDWYGHTVTPSRVLYLAVEGASGLGKRITAWCEDTHEAEAMLEELKWLAIPLDLLTEDDAAGVVAAARIHRANVVFIDTVARSMPGANENDSMPYSRLVAVADRLRAHGMTVVLVHHSPKDGHGMRGHTTLAGAVDTAIEAQRAVGAPTTTLTMTKQKDFGEAEPVTLKLRTVADSVVLDRLEGRGSPTVSGKRLLDVLRANRETAMGLAEIVDQSGVARSTCSRALKELQDAGLINNANPYGVAQWRLTESDLGECQ